MYCLDKVLKWSALPAVAFLLLSTMPLHAHADDHVDLPYDWVLQIETHQLKRQFEYKGSSLNPIEKLEVSWHPTDDENKITKYEQMYYHDGRPFGMEKLHKMDIEQGEGVAIEIKHKDNNANDAEKKAAANAVVRLALDSYINKNPLAAVKVPIDSFDTVSGHLIDMGFKEKQDDANDFDKSEKSDMTLFLYSVPDGKKQTLIR